METPQIHGLFNEIFYKLKRFVYFRFVYQYLIVSLTIFLSYFQGEFDAVPYLHFVGPEDTGKSTVLKIIELSGFNPSYAIQATDAATCRLIHQNKGIFILDEAEIFSMPRLSSFSHKVFRTGYKKGAPPVWVCDKNDPYGLIPYSVYGVKVTANIRGIHDKALKSRFIIITMSEPNPEQCPQIFLPDSDGKIFSTIGANLLLLSKDESLRNAIKDAYLKLREDERIKEITGRNFEIFAPLFASAKVIDESAGKEFLFKHVLKFAKRYIDERKEEDFFTDWPTMVIFSVWKYVEPLLETSDFAENKYFWAEGLCEHVRKDLKLHFEKLDLEFGVKKLGKLLDIHNILLGPEKRKVKRVRFDEDVADFNKPATHFHLDVDKLKLFADESKKYEDEDVNKTPMSGQRLEQMDDRTFIKKVRDRHGRKSKDGAEPQYLHRNKWGD